MEKAIVKDSVKIASDLAHRVKSQNPLMVRKKFAMKDVCFRRNTPEVEAFRFEVAFDVEVYAILILLTVLAAGLCVKIAGCSRRRKIRRQLRQN